jgi:[acyl-carrier-protein] S-malonyltransferase
LKRLRTLWAWTCIRWFLREARKALKITENTQPAILTASACILAPILERGIFPHYVAGLSLGEYNAHVASGTFSFGDAVKVVRKRGKYMQEAVPEGVGTMAAILGLSKESVVDICQTASQVGVVEPANFNCPGQIVIAGTMSAVSKAMDLAKEKGAKRAMMLAVSAPFHTSMLESAGKKLEEALLDVTLQKMQVPLVSNVTAEVVSDIAEVKELLVKQVSRSVLWEDSVLRMLQLGVDTFVEIGPGKVLTGFIRKIAKDAKVFNVEDLHTLQECFKMFGA